MITIGIDIGTTTISAVVMDIDKKAVLASQTIDNGTFINGEEWERIQDPGRIIEKATSLLDKFLDEWPQAAGIGLTGQMHGIVYLDRNGRAISPLYTWQDKRADLQIGSFSTVQRITNTYGIPAAGGYGLLSHIYNLNAGLVPENAVSIATIMDYLGIVLTGRKKALMHAGNAASLGFYDSEHFCFYKEYLEKEGVYEEFLPEVTLSVEALGSYRNIPVYTALGDNQASFLGAVGTQPGAWQINVGTGGQISVLSNKAFTAPGIEARPYLDGTWILTGSVLCAGRAYAILEHFFREYAAAAGAPENAQYGIMSKLAEEEVDAEPLIVSTKFAGTRTDADIRGSITNIGEQNFTPAGLIRGVMQGITDEFFEVVQPILTGTDTKVERIIGSGNGLRKNPFLQNCFKNTFGADLTMSEFIEEAASGAALCIKYAKE